MNRWGQLGLGHTADMLSPQRLTQYTDSAGVLQSLPTAEVALVCGWWDSLVVWDTAD